MEMKIPMLSLHKGNAMPGRRKESKATMSITGHGAPKIDGTADHAKRLREACCDAAVESTRRWVAGDIETHKHKENMRRAKVALAAVDREAGPSMRSMKR